MTSYKDNFNQKVGEMLPELKVCLCVSVTFIQISNNRLLLEEIIAEFLTQSKGQHIMGESSVSAHSNEKQ